MKKVMLVVFLLFVSMQSLWAITADEVLRGVENRYIGKTSQSDLYMKLQDKGGKVRTRKMTILRRKENNDNKDNFIHFAAPPDIRNTTYLVNEKNRERQKWIFLSAFKNIRKIVTSDFGLAFVSSDFTYEDMDDMHADEYTCSNLKEEKFNGQDVYSFQCVKKNGNTSYSRIMLKVAKDTLVTLQALMYDKGDPKKLVKQMDATELKKVSDIWTPYIVTMKDLEKGTQTSLEIKQIKYDLPLKEDTFSKRNMKK